MTSTTFRVRDALTAEARTAWGALPPAERRCEWFDDFTMFAADRYPSLKAAKDGDAAFFAHIEWSKLSEQEQRSEWLGSFELFERAHRERAERATA